MKKLILFLLFSPTFFCVPAPLVYGGPNYVATIFPFYDIVKTIVGERGAVFVLLPPGASPHTFHLRPSDMKKVGEASGLILGGPGLDEWAFELPSALHITLLELVPDSLLLAFQTAHEFENHADGSHHHGEGIDPHFWTDPLTVRGILPRLTELLCELDEAGADVYRANAAAFAVRLGALHEKIQALLAAVEGSAVLLSHPFYNYFFSRYGLELAGVTELSPGSESTPREIARYIKLVEDRKVRSVFTHSQLPDRSAILVAEACGITVTELDPIGGVKGRNSYEEMTWYNAELILRALR